MRVVWLLVCAGCLRAPHPSGTVSDAALPGSCAMWGPWLQPQAITELEQSGVQEYSPWLSGDGRELLFCPAKAATLEIYGATRTSATFMPAAPLGMPVNVAGTVSDNPMVSDDGLTLYFDSNRVGGATKLFFATRSSPGAAFSTVTPLPDFDPGPTITPAVSHDQLALFFTVGTTSYSIEVATRTSMTEPFAGAQTILLPPDSESPSLSPDGRELYYVQNAHSTPNIAVAQVDASYQPTGTYAVPFGEAQLQFDPSISAAGDTLVFAMQDPNSGTFEIYTSTRMCITR